VSNVENIGDMFHLCKNFKQNLDRWDVSNVNNMETAFYECPTKPKWYDEDKWE
jgi:surface protein